MRKKIVFVFVFGSLLFTVPFQTGCGSGDDCAKPGESCMEKNCCPNSDGMVSRSESYTYDNGLQKLSSCTCN
jgi:hypothetical protein